MKVMTMGLDMYACKTKETITAPVDFNVKDAENIHYWRKHPNLHGWMERLYRLKDGKEASFNVVNLQLTGDDLDQLEQTITGKHLPFTEGFFFGESDRKSPTTWCLSPRHGRRWPRDTRSSILRGGRHDGRRKPPFLEP